jgi:diphosphomevalonate decarboxylase
MWTSEAPSNVALIKYMGKQSGNIPCNGSLAHTLNKFVTRVILEKCQEDDQFIDEMKLGPPAASRFLRHLKNIKRIFNYNGFFRVKSRSNFPHSAGIASSSSSFAALTKCAITAVCQIKGITQPSCEEMSEISREASGASCRSFFSPWSLWDCKGARKIDLKIGELNHDLILIDQNPKGISSSEAHERIKSSPLFVGRPQRAEKRLADLVDSLNNSRWSNACQICWEEFHDMHALFHTSAPTFEYMQLRTRTVLDTLEKFYKINNDGPIVTIDAGPNVHLLWRKDQDEQRGWLMELFYEKKVNCYF